jgi:hypothetical protein
VYSNEEQPSIAVGVHRGRTPFGLGLARDRARHGGADGKLNGPVQQGNQKRQHSEYLRFTAWKWPKNLLRAAFECQNISGTEYQKH